MHETFLQDLSVILLVAGIATLLCHRFRQPVVLGYLVAGLIIGPNTPPFPLVHDRHTIELLAELGVILLMFGLGLHFSLRKLPRVGVTALLGAGMEIGIMFLAGYGLGRTIGWSPMDSIFLGSMLSMSSTTIIIKALGDLRLSGAPFASLVFGILIIEDIVGIAILALMSGVATAGSFDAMAMAITLGKLGIFMISVVVIGLLTVPPLLKWVGRLASSEMLLIVSLGLCFGVSLLALKLGYSVALGAFLIGAVVAEARNHQAIDTLVGPVRDVFAAVFFVAIGMLIDPHALVQHALPIFLITVLVIVGKIIGSGTGTFLAGNDTRTSLRVGMSLAQIGEFSFIIASLGLSLKVTSDFIYPIAVAVSAVTTLLTPYLIKGTDPVADWFGRRSPKRLAVYLALYTRWVRMLGRSATTAPVVRRLLIRWTLQLALNFSLMTGVMIAAAWLGGLQAIRQSSLPAWTGGAPTAIWFAATLVMLPILIATLRKLRAVAMALAELSVSRSAGQKNTQALRAVIANTILCAGVLFILLWGFAITSAVLPPWPVLVCLLVVVVAIAGVMWNRFIRIYAMAQIQLAATLTQEPEPSSPSVPPVLEGAEMRSVMLNEAAPANGKRLSELQLRARTGAVVIGLERDGIRTINPDPQEKFRPGDQLLVLGTPVQLDAAVELLTITASPQHGV